MSTIQGVAATNRPNGMRPRRSLPDAREQHRGEDEARGRVEQRAAGPPMTRARSVPNSRPHVKRSARAPAEAEPGALLATAIDGSSQSVAPRRPKRRVDQRLVDSAGPTLGRTAKSALALVGDVHVGERGPRTLRPAAARSARSRRASAASWNGAATPFRTTPPMTGWARRRMRGPDPFGPVRARAFRGPRRSRRSRRGSRGFPRSCGGRSARARMCVRPRADRPRETRAAGHSDASAARSGCAVLERDEDLEPVSPLREQRADRAADALARRSRPSRRPRARDQLLVAQMAGMMHAVMSAAFIASIAPFTALPTASPASICASLALRALIS